MDKELYDKLKDFCIGIGILAAQEKYTGRDYTCDILLKIRKEFYNEFLQNPPLEDKNQWNDDWM